MRVSVNRGYVLPSEKRNETIESEVLTKNCLQVPEMEFNVDPGSGVTDGKVITPTSFEASLGATQEIGSEFGNVGDLRLGLHIFNIY